MGNPKFIAGEGWNPKKLEMDGREFRRQSLTEAYWVRERERERERAISVLCMSVYGRISLRIHI